jgi:hypothetical protein
VSSSSKGVDVPLMSDEGVTHGLMLQNVPEGQFLYISGHLNGEWASDITCTISVDGLVVAKTTGSGQYAIASCEGTVT